VIEEVAPAAADGLSEPRFPAAGWSTRPVGRGGPDDRLVIRRSLGRTVCQMTRRCHGVSIAMPQCNRYIALRSPLQREEACSEQNRGLARRLLVAMRPGMLSLTETPAAATSPRSHAPIRTDAYSVLAPGHRTRGRLDAGSPACGEPRGLRPEARATG
jgi:hypothetical protein